MKKTSAVLKDVYLDAEIEEELQNRLSRIEGHIRGIKRMLAEQASCEDLLIQFRPCAQHSIRRPRGCLKTTWRPVSPTVYVQARVKRRSVNSRGP